MISRRDLDRLTKKEKRQFFDWVNNKLSVQFAAMQRRKRVNEARNKIESEERKWKQLAVI